MYALLKFILIFFCILWLISKVFGFAARVFLGKVAKQNGGRGFSYQKTYQYGGNRSEAAKPKEGNVHIDYVPKESKGKGDNFKGGDYVDYEEVK
ncbi:DUF4834 family protein [Reichenbachiella versicolor]|uniref:DUF4834 family protein n=1 Tax=Reichenbachiella versicolor TaxID=1821036 RepID=UPI000D6E5FAB|nr:DUF4834 family protein [Reichenbachiella versicolor]